MAQTEHDISELTAHIPPESMRVHVNCDTPEQLMCLQASRGPKCDIYRPANT